jgi:CHRD domain
MGATRISRRCARGAITAAALGSALTLLAACDDAARYRYPVLGAEFRSAPSAVASLATLQAAAGEAKLQTLSARGVQTYPCRFDQDDPRLTVWSLVASETDLFGAAGRLIGRQRTGLEWVSADGSRVTGTETAHAAAPGADAIAWSSFEARSGDARGASRAAAPFAKGVHTATPPAHAGARLEPMQPRGGTPTSFPETSMTFSHTVSRSGLLAATLGAALLLSACSSPMNLEPAAPMMAKQMLRATLSSAAEVPPNASSGSGTMEGSFDKASGVMRWKVTYTGLTGPATMAHFHGPAMPGSNAGVVVPFPSAASPAEGMVNLTAAQATDLMTGKWYVNVHTAQNPGGEIRGQVLVN